MTINVFLVVIIEKVLAKKKTPCFCGTYAVRPLQKKYMNQKVIRKFNDNNNIFYLNTVGFKANIAYGAV